MPTIDDTLARLNQAWNDGDAAAYAALFTDDATYIVFDGTLLTGRQEIEDLHRFLFEGPLRNSRLGDGQAPVASLRLVRPDTAHLILNGGVRLPEQQTLPPDRASVVSLLLVSDPTGDWLITAFHNTRRTP
jgi:uncharacterized protein (TIGR02246 family)